MTLKNSKAERHKIASLLYYLSNKDLPEFRERSGQAAKRFRAAHKERLRVVALSDYHRRRSVKMAQKAAREADPVVWKKRQEMRHAYYLANKERFTQVSVNAASKLANARQFISTLMVTDAVTSKIKT